MKIFSIFLDTRPFCKHILKKTLAKFAKNEAEAVKVAVLATQYGFLATLRGMSGALHCMSVLYMKNFLWSRIA